MNLTPSAALRSPLKYSLVLAAASLVLPAPILGAAGQPSAPPAFPDTVHVTRGCYISSLAYVSRFTREYPAESAYVLTVAPRNFDGAHTIAVLTWRGAWWGRDEYSGVFPLDVPADGGDHGHLLRTRAENRLQRIASRHLQTGRILAEPDNVVQLPIAARERDVIAAAALLPLPAAVIRVRCGNSELPFLFFQPRAGQIAIYDPATGTATGECTPSNIPALVAQVAIRLGYRVDRAVAAGSRLAANG